MRRREDVHEKAHEEQSLGSPCFQPSFPVRYVNLGCANIRPQSRSHSEIRVESSINTVYPPTTR
jgi:hypothetical protein